jgi:hypothetical protein
VLDSPAQSRSSSISTKLRAVPKRSKKTPKIPKNRTGSGRPKGDHDTHNPEVEGFKSFPRNQQNKAFSEFRPFREGFDSHFDSHGID